MYVIAARYGLSTQVPSLPIGVLGYDIDTKSLRVGDGTSTPPKILTTKATGDFDFTNANPSFSGAFIASLSTPGTDGWTPEYAIVNLGERRVMKVVDWTGGTGTKPSADLFMSATGFTTDSELAIDMRGPKGSPGSPPAILFTVDALGNLIIEQDDETLTNPLEASVNEAGELLVTYGDGEVSTSLNMGRVVTLFQGDFDDETQYVGLDEVKYQADLYRAKYGVTIPIGTLPSDDAFWDVIMQNAFYYAGDGAFPIQTMGITQAAYDALVTPDPNTAYFIVDAV